VILGVERHGQPIAFQQIFNEFPKLRTGNFYVVAEEMGGPIKSVHRTLRIIAGHARLLAAQELGWREVPTILLDHLSEAEAYAFAIADNRVAETATWNNTLLTEQLNQISRATPDIAIETTGFELTEIGLLTAKGTVGVRKPSRRPTPRPVPPLSPARRDVPTPRPPK
jgi:hypothetical protein